MNPIGPALVMGHDEVAEHLDRDERRVLCPEIVVELQHLDTIAYRFGKPLQILQSDIDQFFA